MLVEHDELPGRVRLHSMLGLNGPTGHVPDATPGPVELGSTRGVDWALCLPPGKAARGLPVVVALSGKNNGRGYLLDSLGLPQFLAASRQPMAILAVAGGSSYYHRRRDGSDTGAVVLDDLLPELGARGLSVSSPGFLGWSMGGYGALLLASERRRAGRAVAGVAASSPALWASYDAVPPGAFDSRADFERYGMFNWVHDLADTAVRLDCGEGDPFYFSVQKFARRARAEAHFAPGAHNGAYWRRVLASQLRWLGGHLRHAAT